jgi:hypothetical protein
MLGFQLPLAKRVVAATGEGEAAGKINRAFNKKKSGEDQRLRFGFVGLGWRGKVAITSAASRRTSLFFECMSFAARETWLGVGFLGLAIAPSQLHDSQSTT